MSLPADFVCRLVVEGILKGTNVDGVWCDQCNSRCKSKS